MENPQVTHAGIFSCQVCVPATYTDDEAKDFLESQCPCGTTNGWVIRKDGDENLGGAPERVPCDSRAGFVHIMFDA